MTDDEKKKASVTPWLAGRLLVMAIGMFGFGFLLVPLYSVFCDITGFGGRTNETPASVEASAPTSRSVALEFVTTVNEYAPWEFHSDLPGMTVHPGQIYDATFTAKNLSDQHKIAQAVPSVAPQEAAKYLKKINCFCFTTQEFEAHETRELPVRFVIDSDLPDYVDTITLSYTFFDVSRLSQNSPDSSPDAHPAR